MTDYSVHILYIKNSVFQRIIYSLTVYTYCQVCGVGEGSSSYTLAIPSKQNYWEASLSCSKLASDGRIPAFGQLADWQVSQ